MSSVKPIRTQADYESALMRIDELMGATPESPEEAELEALADLVDEYEVALFIAAAMTGWRGRVARAIAHQKRPNLA